MTPHQWLAKLAALVPPPKVHVVRYHGVFFAKNVPTTRAAVPTGPTSTLLRGAADALAERRIAALAKIRDRFVGTPARVRSRH